MPSSFAERSPARKIGLIPLIFAIFCLVSGGPYGIESVIEELGPRMGLLMIVITPIVWALPAALMAAELGSAIPDEGGYVVWVKQAMGPFWSFLAAWWSWLYSVVDAAMYPVMFATYLSKAIVLFTGSMVFEALPTKAIPALALIAVITFLNVIGVRQVGRVAIVLGLLVIVPFLWMGLQSGPIHLEAALSASKSTGNIATGLAVVMWNYLGFDCLSTVAGEVKDPKKTFPRALLISIFLITIVYLIPILAALTTVPNAADWKEGSWPEIATRVAGTTTGRIVLICAIASPAAMFLSQMLASSRIPYVLAQDGLLPKSLDHVHPKLGTPVRAILLCACAYGIFSFVAFKDLALANVFLYASSLVLEFLALAILRKKQPSLERPFRIPGGWSGIALVILAPFGLIALLVWSTLQSSTLMQVAPILLAIASGPIAYMLATRKTAAKGSY